MKDEKATLAVGMQELFGLLEENPFFYSVGVSQDNEGVGLIAETEEMILVATEKDGVKIKVSPELYIMKLESMGFDFGEKLPGGLPVGFVHSYQDYSRIMWIGEKEVH